MQSPGFQEANQVFDGNLRINRQEGQQPTAHKQPIAGPDLQCLDHYLAGWANDNVILQRKVFFDLMYGFARRGREGLRELTKNSFVIGVLPDGRPYLQESTKRATKKGQGDEPKGRDATGEPNMLVGNGGPNCQIATYRFYLTKLHPKNEALFQRPKGPKLFNPASPLWYDGSAKGKNTLSQMMKKMSAPDAANLSRLYTNHCIRGTSATALYREGMTLQEVANVTGHVNLESLRFYLEKPTLMDKAKAADALQAYRDRAKRVLQASIPALKKKYPKLIVPTEKQQQQEKKRSPFKSVVQMVPLPLKLHPPARAEKYFTPKDFQLMAADIGEKTVMEAVENDQTALTDEEHHTYMTQRAAMGASQIENISLSKIRSTQAGSKYNFSGASFSNCTFSLDNWVGRALVKLEIATFVLNFAKKSSITTLWTFLAYLRHYKQLHFIGKAG